MIIVIFLICIAFMVLGYLIDRRSICDDEIRGIIVMGFGVVGLAVSFIVLICLLIGVTNLKTIDSKIEMYQEENVKIENQIENPELKSDTLVAKQIEAYIANNEKIKELKEEKINGDMLRWWLYFGGNDNNGE